LEKVNDVPALGEILFGAFMLYLSALDEYE
jgi:hypothetical protein